MNRKKINQCIEESRNLKLKCFLKNRFKSFWHGFNLSTGFNSSIAECHMSGCDFVKRNLETLRFHCYFFGDSSTLCKSRK